MSEEIVRRLRNRSKKDLNFIRESLNRERIHEADEDEEDPIDTPEEDDEEKVVDTPPPEEDIDTEEETPSEEDTPDEDEYVDPDGEVEDDTDGSDENDHEYVNPLDNAYAVKHTIGDEILLAYSNGTNSKLKGEIDGYDKEGFYRIRWANGLTTNGITDLAIADLVSKKHENTCVCGSRDFVNEGKYVVCDKCGRHIRESADPLTLADKSRPKGKKLVRSEAHPTSTVLKPNISESIRKAFKKGIREESDDIFSKLRSLDGEFWSRESEMREDIEDLGYSVDAIDSDGVTVYMEDDEGNDHSLLIPVIGTSRTMTLDFDHARKL